MKKPFSAAQFTDNRSFTAERKAKFANHFVRFAEGGFKESVFPEWFYRHLSTTFGHIAHYDRQGFYAAKFATAVHKRDFLVGIVTSPFYMSAPNADVEDAVRQWVRKSGLVEKAKLEVALRVEAHERAELARLKAKYEPQTETQRC